MDRCSLSGNLDFSGRCQPAEGTWQEAICPGGGGALLGLLCVASEVRDRPIVTGKGAH